MSNEGIKATKAMSANRQQAGTLADIWWMGSVVRKQMIVILSLIGVIAAMIVFLVAVIVMRPAPQYFASTPDMRFVQLAPMSAPLITDTGLNNWVADTVTRSLSLDFAHWQTTLGDLRIDFSKEAFDAFITNLKSSGLLDKVVKQRLVLSAVPESAPIIANQGVLAGKYVWMIKFPIKVSYEGSSGVLGTQVFKATVMVQRADVSTHPRGVFIQQIILD